MNNQQQKNQEKESQEEFEIREKYEADYNQVYSKLNNFEYRRPEAVKVDFFKCRLDRQKKNNSNVFNSIKENNKEKFYAYINKKQLERTLSELSFTLERFWKKCITDDMFAEVISVLLAKKATRQCMDDENNQLILCNKTSSPLGVQIKKLSSCAMRPMKDGRIITGKEMKQNKISKDQCLKSFDAIIAGKMSGFISAKVSYGSGGHQDNVWEEMDTLAEWWSIHRTDTSEYLIILIETDAINKLDKMSKKYTALENILFLDHYRFQEFLIDKFSDS
jgi:hypothetical protein